jgi:ribosomal protein S18 acetylase RimI-like enzyme
MLMAIRPASLSEAAIIAQVHDVCWRAAYTAILPDSVVRSSTLIAREALWTDLLARPAGERCAFVAEVDGAIVGCAWGGPEESGDPHYRAELLGLYLLPEHQRRGLGRRLVAAVAEQFARQGESSLLLWALAENSPARRFYEALGGQLLYRRDTVLSGLPVPEVAYGWPDLRALCRAPSDDGSDGGSTAA